MASSQAKIGQKRTRKSENKNCLSVPFLPDGKYKIPKIEKKNKKKNTIVALFHVKIGCKRTRKRENKNYRSVPYQPNA